MSKLLAIDIGNTNITAGLFKNERLVKKIKWPSHDKSSYTRSVNHFVSKGRCALDRVLISSVVPSALVAMKKVLRAIAPGRINVIGVDICVPISNLYKKRDQVGQDRLVNAYAAARLYRAPAVIIDFGTAVTFDVISKDQEYLGGLIVPGIEMGLKSLHDKTALLPRIELKRAGRIIGRDTIESMRGGILYGYGAMCDGLVSRYRAAFGEKISVIATGGNAGLIRHYARSIGIVDEDLTLKGLMLIAAKCCDIPVDNSTLR